MRTALIRILALLLGIAIPAAVAELGLRLLPVSTGSAMQTTNADSPVLRFEPNRDFVYSKGPWLAQAIHGHINNDGFVSGQDYDATSTEPLLAVIGDSYIEARLVAYPDTIQGRLAERASPGRVYSFGISSAPLSQYLAFARYARATYDPQGFIFVVVGNDFDESLVDYVAKPGMHQFERRPSGELKTVLNEYAPSLSRRVARHSGLARYIMLNLGGLQQLRNIMYPRRYVGNTAEKASSERLTDSLDVINEFFARLSEATGLPAEKTLFVLDAIRPEIYEPAQLAQISDSYFSQMRSAFTKRARAYGSPVIDLQPHFIELHQQTGQRFESEIDYHWNPAGHEAAANLVADTAFFRRMFEASR